MGCCLGVFGLAFPRAALVIMWLLSYTATAFETRLWPLLGFFFMPYTACAYAIAVNEVGAIEGWGLALLIVGVVFDAGSHGGGARSGREHYRRLRIRVDR